MEKVTIYTDGGARNNPGPAALGVVFKNNKGQTIKEYSQYLGQMTNNQAEYQAIIFALRKAKGLKFKKVDCLLDSQLVAEQLNHRYKIKEEGIIPLFIKVWNLMLDFDQVNFKYIPRAKNKEADKLVNQILNAKQKEKTLPGL